MPDDKHLEALTELSQRIDAVEAQVNGYFSDKIFSPRKEHFDAIMLMRRKLNNIAVLMDRLLDYWALER